MTVLFDLDRVLLFTLLLARAAGLVAVAPFLGEPLVPSRIKALLAATLAFLMLTLTPEPPPMPGNLAALVLLTLAELSVGLAVGYIARLLILAFEMAGHIVAVQMGFGMAQIFDPVQGHQGNLMGRWMWMVGMTVFLGLGGHHHMVRALAGTLDVLPPGTGVMNAPTLEILVDAGARCFATAMSIGAPAIGILLLTSVGLGLLARTVPQMNVFIVGFPIKITAGIVGILLSLPYMLEVARRELSALVIQLSELVGTA